MFQFATLNEAQDMAKKILDVAHGDQVAVNLTIGCETPFFGFLQEVGLSREDIKNEMVDRELAPIPMPGKGKAQAKGKTKASTKPSTGAKKKPAAKSAKKPAAKSGKKLSK